MDCAKNRLGIPMTQKRKATDTELKTVTELPTKHARQIPVTYAEDSDSDSAIRPAPKARSKYDSVDVPRKPFSAKSNISPESDDLPPMKGKAELKAKNAIFAKPKDKEMAKEKDNKKRLGAVDEDVEDAVEEEKGKKKKRKLGNLMKGATFTWDQSKVSLPRYCTYELQCKSAKACRLMYLTLVSYFIAEP